MSIKHKTPIFTIGYGSRSLDDLVFLLKANQIAFLIDVRSKPYSQYKPDFSIENLRKRISSEGLAYVFMGDTLGGQPDIPSLYTEDGKINYSKLKEKEFFKRGILRLQEAWEKQLRVVLLCSEGKPEMCHRSKLIGEVLRELKINVMHFDENDDLVPQEEVMYRLTDGQLCLFENENKNYTSRKSYKSKVNKTNYE